ncbi:ABC transporter ATP-binding protein [Streptomyces sp. NPDC040724]|uniref:ABC transporter ATP-binding protein n=1 Tax=Streptomyces sp. NPDC040724 TaxID=3155612 RepID=UPI0033BFBCC5
MDGDLRASGLRLIRLLRPDRGLYAAVIALAMCSVTLAAAGPILLGRATDIIVAGTVADGVWPVRAVGVDFSSLRTQLMWALLTYTGASLAGLAQERLMTRVVGNLVFSVRRRVGEKMNRLPLAYYDRHPRGEVLSRATHDIDAIGQSLQQTMSQIVGSTLTVAVVLAAMAWLSVPMMLVMVVMVPVSLKAAARMTRGAQPHFTAQRRATGELNAHIEEAYRGQAVIKGFGREKETAEEFERVSGSLSEAVFRSHFISGLIRPVMMFLGNLNYVVLAAVGGLLVVNGSLSVGQVQAFLMYAREFNQPFSQIAGVSTLLQSGLASAARVFELLDEDEVAADPPEPARPGRIGGRVDFEHVSFAYTDGQPVIKDLSLSVPPGRTVAIVGPSGAGKTTLVNLLMRFYDLSHGRILLDGVDLALMNRETVRASIGMVLQETWLFHGTIAENIAYGNPSSSPDAVVKAAEAACADDFIRSLPLGYETVVGGGGTHLSAGEEQLICIARAFLGRPAILILDEATSQVDSRTEMRVRRATNELRAGRTCFVIAHRLSTIRDADVILYLADGRIAEQGTHQGLLDAGGAYARLCAAQAGQHEERSDA